MKEKTKLEGYVVPRNMGTIDTTTRILIGGVGKTVTSLLGAYAGYQIAGFDVADIERGLGLIAHKAYGGLIETAADVQACVEYVVENIEDIKNMVLNILQPETHQTASGDIYKKLLESTAEHNITAQRAIQDIIKTPIETLIASLGTAKSLTWSISGLIDLITLRDKPDYTHRMRMGFANMFRGKDTSRKVDIPKEGGDNFTRVA